MTARPGTTMTADHPSTGAVVLLASVALAAFAAPAPAMAAPPPAAGSATFALTATGTPGAVRLRGAPGATLRGSVLVRNLSRRPTTVRLQPADIRNATSGDADYVTSRLSAAGSGSRPPPFA
jgi:hypothetical protein